MFGLGSAHIVGYSYMKAYSEQSDKDMDKILKEHEAFMLQQDLKVENVSTPFKNLRNSAH